jgi:BA14K-like protein
MKTLPAVLVAALTVASLPSIVAPAAAAPIAVPMMLSDAVAPSAEAVRYRGGGGGWHGGGGGAGVAIGAGIAGALIGGAIIGATQPQGYYGYPNGYYGRPAYVEAPPYEGDAVGYCQQRYRSYDPYSGTYLGFDGLRHPCP